jgi:mono/diheme cytochrome c family protein
MRLLLRSGVFAILMAITLGAQAPKTPAYPPIPDTNPFTSDADVQRGSVLFQTNCTYCHGANGEGGRGADLTTGLYRHGTKDPELYASIRFGIPGTEMAPVRVTDDEVWKLVAFVRRLGSQGMMEKAPGDASAGRAVYQRLHRVSSHGERRRQSWSGAH